MKSFSEYINDKASDIAQEATDFAEANEKLSVIKIPEKIGESYSILSIVRYLFSQRLVEIHNSALDTDTKYVFFRSNIHIIFELKDGFWRIHLSPHVYRSAYWRTIKNLTNTLLQAFAQNTN